MIGCVGAWLQLARVWFIHMYVKNYFRIQQSQESSCHEVWGEADFNTGRLGLNGY